MAFTKYISAIAFVTYFSFYQLNAAPTTEYAEFRANQAETMRAQRITINHANHAPALNRVAPQDDRSCLASLAHVFFTLMEHAGNAAPHPTIYTRK